MLHQCNISNSDLALGRLQREFPHYLKSDTLYYIGDEPKRNRFHLGIIGSRRPSPESEKLIESLLERVQDLPLRVISGGALGVDAQAHSAALRLGIPTYSWVVGDPSHPTPHSNQFLFSKISRTEGCSIITPHCLFRHRNIGLVNHFWLERNAWIAANCDLLLVVQAKERSGTWSTVKVCQDLGIACYAMTGSPLDPCYSGNSLMISMNYAHPLSHIGEFAEDLKAHLKNLTHITEKKDNGPETPRPHS